MLKIVRKLFTSILAMLLVIGPITMSNNEVNAEDTETQKVKITLHWDDDDNAKNYRPEMFTVNLYTEPDMPFAKYAVQLYGIGQDVDTDGFITGLTFGPAIGADYTNSYKEHSPTGNTIGENPHRCIHDDSWERIIYWSSTDPYVYEQCVTRNCTHDVPLHEAGQTILNSEFDGSKITGDGVGALYHELILQPDGVNSTVASYENLRYHQNNYPMMGVLIDPVDRTHGSNHEGWGASRTRAMLNGADIRTDQSDGSYPPEWDIYHQPVYSPYAATDINKSASIYTSINNLLSCFPEELQRAIVARETVYSATFFDDSVGLKTTFDKLWLLSPAELGYEGNLKQKDPGRVGVYQKFLSQSLKDEIHHTNSWFLSYTAKDSSNSGYKPISWYLRSVSDQSIDGVYTVDSSGKLSTTYAVEPAGIAPAFTLKGRRSPSDMAVEENNSFLSKIFDSLHDTLKLTKVNAEDVLRKYSLTLPTADGDVDYVFHIPANEEVTKITAQEPNTHYEQELNLDLSDMNNLKVNMRSNGPKVPGSTAKLKKYLVVKNDTEIPEAEFNFTVSAGTAIGAADNHATVYAGKDSDKVKVNGTAKTGKVTFTAGEDTTVGPLTDVATADQKYAMKDIVLDFSDVSFDEPGVYRYILTEQENTNSAINNDSEPVRVVDVHVMWNDDETELVVDGYVGYYGTVAEAPKLLPDFEYEYEDTNGDEVISNEEKEAQKEAYDAAYSDFITSIQDGSGKPTGSYVNAQEPIEVEAGTKSDKYVNTLDSANLSLTKEVKGNQGSKDQYFEFTVEINNAGKGTVLTLDTSEAENGVTHENNATSFSKASMDEANLKDDDKTDILYSEEDYNTYVTENNEEPEWSVGDVKKPAKAGQQLFLNDNGSITFKLYLHHGQTMSILGLPKNSTYTITETAAAGYNTISENNNGTALEDNIDVLFINERSGIIPTGILVSASGAFALLGVSILWFILNIRRKLREE